MFNAAATIGETIESVRAQSVDEWEWHLMDDGSSDDTATLAEQALAGDARARVVRCGRVGHIGVLRNRALASVTAPYVCFLDADDCWAPTFLERQRAVLGETGAQVAHCAARHIVDGSVVDVPPKYQGPAVCNPPEMLRQLYPRNPIYSPSVVIETDALKKEGGFSEEPDHTSVLDIDLWLRMAPKCRFAYNPQRLLSYRVSGQSLSFDPQNQVRNYRGEIAALERAIGRSHELPGDLQRLMRKLLSRRQSQYARVLLDQSPPALDLSRDALRSACRIGPFATRYLPFQVLSLAGRRPPYLLHRVLRRLRG